MFTVRFRVWAWGGWTNPEIDGMLQYVVHSHELTNKLFVFLPIVCNIQYMNDTCREECLK